MNASTPETTVPWTDLELESLTHRLIHTRRLLDAFPPSLPGPHLLRRAPERGPDAVEAVPLAGELVVGKHGDLPLAFPDDGPLGRRHFRVVVGPDDQCHAGDLASRNGLWINGRRVKGRLLIHGDLIHAGSQDFVFHAGRAPEWGADEVTGS